MTEKKKRVNVQSIKKTVDSLTLIMQEGGSVKPKKFAKLAWPDSPKWETVRKCGKSGYYKGMGMFVAAGQYLGRLAKKGYLEKNSKTGKYGITEAGATFLEEQAKHSGEKSENPVEIATTAIHPLPDAQHLPPVQNEETQHPTSVNEETNTEGN